jgi:hypothetical protein
MMEELATLYQEGMSMREVARRTGISFSTVRLRLVSAGLHRITHRQVQDGIATCKCCGERKPQSEFPRLAVGKYRCVLCLRDEENEAQLHRLGSSKTEYHTLFTEQGGKCAICGAIAGHRSKFGKICRLAIDHNHRTKKVRGLLCNNCNRGLGRFKDSIENLEAAIRYLKREQ